MECSMKMTRNVLLLFFCALLMVGCKKDNVRQDTDLNDGNDNTVVDGSYTVDTNPINLDPSSICCSPDDLDNPDSLLAQRVILFDYDQSSVRPEYRDVVEIHARYLSQNPSARVTLEGHADERGSREYNLALGERRGKSVASLLTAQGASANQVDVVSYGEERPAALCGNNSCWSQNRRVEIVYTSK